MIWEEETVLVNRLPPPKWLINRGSMEATSAWFETLDDAMDLFTTSRRLTCRSNRIVTRCAMDSIDIDATTTTRRAARCGFDAVKIDFSMPRRSSDRSFDFDYDDASGIRNTFFEDYCDFPKNNTKTTTNSGKFRLKPVTSSPFKSEEHFCKGSKTRSKVRWMSLFVVHTLIILIPLLHVELYHVNHLTNESQPINNIYINWQQ